MHRIGHPIIHYPEIDSTNREAWRLSAASTLTAGTIILADFQYDGKGQAGNSWESEAAKNLLMSVILKPGSIAAGQQFAINMAVSMALSEAVTTCCKGITSLIKWPNDIYIGQKKIGGILIENSIMGAAILSSVVGIGLNINQLHFTSDAPNPTSVIQLTDRVTPLSRCLRIVCQSLEKWTSLLTDDGHAYLRQAYHKRLLGYQQYRTFRDAQGAFSGKITGVDEFGHLTIESSGKLRKYGFKEVSFIF